MADSEELLGDTAEVTDWPEARVRTLMADLLREPARFGLPRWPAPGADPGAASTAARDATPAPTAALPTLSGDAETASAGARPARTHVGAGSRPPIAASTPAHEIGDSEPTAGAAPEMDAPARGLAPGIDAPAPTPASGAASSADPPTADSSQPTTAGEPSAAAAAPPQASPKPRSGRRGGRRAPPEQLSLW
jgi:hypothetical protein